MNFEEALKAMRLGNKVSREAWRGLISCLYREGDKIMEKNPDGSERELDLFGAENIVAEDWFMVT